MTLRRQTLKKFNYLFDWKSNMKNHLQQKAIYWSFTIYISLKLAEKFSTTCHLAEIWKLFVIHDPFAGNIWSIVYFSRYSFNSFSKQTNIPFFFYQKKENKSQIKTYQRRVERKMETERESKATIFPCAHSTLFLMVVSCQQFFDCN